jgi:hypothetical protein
MRRDGRFAGRLLRVREPFEEQKDCFTFEFEFCDGFGRSFGWILPGVRPKISRNLFLNYKINKSINTVVVVL